MQRGDITHKSDHGTGPEVGSSKAGHALRTVTQHSSGSRLLDRPQGVEDPCGASGLRRGLPLRDEWGATPENDETNMAHRAG